MLRKTIGLVVGLGIAASYSEASAQTGTPARNDGSGGAGFGEIVVTAEKREENVQSLPNSISVYTGEALAASGVTGVGAMTQVSPSVQWGESAGEPHLSIRGVGNELINIGAEAGVTIARDGVPLASPLMFRRDFLDTGSIEVLRGPQGTVSGRNSPGGAVNLYSRAPTETFEGSVSVGYGNFNRWTTSGAISGPIAGDFLLGRLAVSYIKDDGWLENTFLNESQNSTDLVHYRGYLTAIPSDRFRVSLILDAFENNGFELAGVDIGRVQPNTPSLSELTLGHPSFDIDDLTFQEDTPGPFTSDGQQYTLRAEWEIGTSGQLTSTTAFQSFHQKGIRDYDATPLSFFPSTPGYLVEDLEQTSQELTYTTDLGERADLVVGTLYLEQSAEEPFGLGDISLDTAPLLFLTAQEVTSIALYAQWRYNLTDELRLTIGDRWTQDEKSYDQSLFIFGAGGPIPTVEDTWSAHTPRLALDYTPSDTLTLYGNIARGFTSGGFNTFSAENFDPQYVWNYEIGLKSYLFDRRVRFNLAAFHSDYTDIQTVLFLPVQGGVTNSLSVTNAGGAEIDGVEAEFEALVGDNLRLTASGTWLNARYTELESIDGSKVAPYFPDADPSTPEFDTVVENLAGNKLPRSPEWQFNFGADYTVPISSSWDLNLVANYAWQSRVFFNFFNHRLLGQGEYGLLNLSAALESQDGNWRLVAFANNATDERYWSNGQFGTGLAAVPYTNGMIGEPRTYGIRIDRHF